MLRGRPPYCPYCGQIDQTRKVSGLYAADARRCFACRVCNHPRGFYPVIAARQKLVTGAVTMVESALQMLSEKEVVELDDERRAAMVSNLMVVLCSERDTQPVVNTGTLYQ